MSRVNQVLALWWYTAFGLFTAVGGLSAVLIGALLMWASWSLTAFAGFAVGTSLCLFSAYWFLLAYREGWKPLNAPEVRPKSPQCADESVSNE